MKSYTALAAFNRQHNLPPDDHLRIKIGIHTGPSILVTLNERLDYFGQTVNVAARVQDIAESGEITLSRAVFEDDRIAEMLKSYPVMKENVSLKGLDTPIEIYRFMVKTKEEADKA